MQYATGFASCTVCGQYMDSISSPGQICHDYPTVDNDKICWPADSFNSLVCSGPDHLDKFCLPGPEVNRAFVFQLQLLLTCLLFASPCLTASSTTSNCPSKTCQGCHSKLTPQTRSALTEQQTQNLQNTYNPDAGPVRSHRRIFCTTPAVHRLIQNT